MRLSGYGLTTRVALLTLVLALVLLAVISLAFTAFGQYRNTLDQVAEEQVQALMAATRLVQQAEGMVNASALLLLAENHFNRRQAVFEVEDRKEWIGRLLSELKDYQGEQVDFEEIAGIKQALFSNLNLINELVRRRINQRVDVYFQDTLDPKAVQELELINAEIGEMIRANRALSQDLTVAVGQQVHYIRTAMVSDVRRLHQDIAVREAWLIYAGGLALLMVLLTAIYVNRSVVARVVQLQQAISQKHPQPGDIPVRGNDEIAWMAQSIHRYVDKINEDERRILQMNEELSFLATHDALTQLHNRHYFDRHINELSARPEASGFSAAMIDIDHFKRINDRYGHDAGDQVIIRFAEQLVSLLPKDVLLARVGGEEFAVIFQQQSLEAATELLEQVRAEIAAHRLDIEGQSLQVSVSIGLSGYCQNGDLVACLKQADRALYQAKHQGRNRLIVFKNEGEAR
ncbi:diguanylate cyclase [Marinospirillum sp.]|uniref:diguanylate cyclase n=1 Tax=Marinospirillum sp. TaxID=2183934 RepID=UPI003A88500F